MEEGMMEMVQQQQAMIEQEQLFKAQQDAIAMGDGANDLAMIEAAGLGIAYRAKPVVSEKADAAIKGASLEPALFFQGYRETQFVRD